MAGGVEAAAIIFSIFVVLRLGIRINLVIYMYVAGIACLMVNFVPDGDHTFLITLVLIGKEVIQVVLAKFDNPLLEHHPLNLNEPAMKIENLLNFKRSSSSVDFLSMDGGRVMSRRIKIGRDNIKAQSTFR